MQSQSDLDRTLAPTSTTSPDLDELFKPDGLLCPTISSSLKDKGYIFRPLRRTDYHHNFLDVLEVLTTVGTISESQWNARFDELRTSGDYFILVIEEESTKTVVGVGSLILERKFIHNCGMVGHVEDIAVAKRVQGKGFGLKMIEMLSHIAKQKKCYKTILDCSEKVHQFYLNCQYKRAGVQMAQYFPDSVQKQPEPVPEPAQQEGKEE